MSIISLRESSQIHDFTRQWKEYRKVTLGIFQRTAKAKDGEQKQGLLCSLR